MTTRKDVNENMRKGEAFVQRAKEEGAEWILFPENLPFVGRDREKLVFAQSLDGDYVKEFTKWAVDAKAWITIGAFPERATKTHTYNTQLTISPKGELVCVYRKIHLFDVELETLKIKESDSILPGKDLKVMELGSFSVGCSICYDLRFPEMYRKLVDMGANVLIVPSAFTKKTGAAHWHALLRARAIENQAYVIAPNQVGNHFGNRWSFGGSVVYDPWGEELLNAGEEEGVFCTEISLERVNAIRREMPVLKHRVF